MPISWRGSHTWIVVAAMAGVCEFVIRAAAEKHLHTYNGTLMPNVDQKVEVDQIPSIGGLFFPQEIPHHPFSWYVIPQHAVNLDDPNQKMVHPIPATLGLEIYLGAVERAISWFEAS
ncbi:hypothetical protein Tco_0741894 [Tanacetum coccineum]